MPIGILFLVFNFTMHKIIDILWKNDFLILKFENVKFNLPLETYYDYSLQKEIFLDEEIFNTLSKLSENFMCRKKAISYLSKRVKTKFQAKVYLEKKKFSREVIEIVLSELVSLKYIDDYNFTELYITSRRSSKVIGLNLLKKELLSKGVSMNIISSVMEKNNIGEIGFDEIYSLAEKKFLSINKVDKLSKVSSFLYSRGFDYEVIGKIIRKLVKKESLDLS
jgi:regulatory protein